MSAGIERVTDKLDALDRLNAQSPFYDMQLRIRRDYARVRRFDFLPVITGALLPGNIEKGYHP